MNGELQRGTSPEDMRARDSRPGGPRTRTPGLKGAAWRVALAAAMHIATAMSIRKLTLSILASALLLSTPAAMVDAKAATIDAKAATINAKAATINAKAATINAKAATISAKAAIISAKAQTINGVAAASSDDGQYFPETGHTLDIVFEAFYYRLGGAAVVGYPITEAFVDPYSEFLIQYFENARFEFAPNSIGEFQVRLTDLGVLLGGWDLTLEVGRFPIGNNPGCRYYAESGHRVCHAFLDYYDAQGGPAVFGYPVTEFRFENGRMVQYFQDFRLDWYPESEPGQRIRVAPLGREHFRLMGYEPSLLEPVVPGDLEDYPVLDIRLNASVLKPLIGTGETQRVYLVVSDQNRQPVSGAAALLTIYLSDGISFRMMPVTDAAGVTQIDLPLWDTVPGSRVALEYTVVYGNLSAITRDSFYIWY